MRFIIFFVLSTWYLEISNIMNRFSILAFASWLTVFSSAYCDSIFLEPNFKGATVTEEALKNLSIEDPNLRSAYIIFFSDVRFPMFLKEPGRPELKAIYSDIVRRGNSATPLILDIMTQNQGNRFEFLVPRHLLFFPEIEKEPYLQRIRERIHSGASDFDSNTAGMFASFISRYGTPSDMTSIFDLVEKRPELGDEIERRLPQLADRIETSEERRIRVHGIGKRPDSGIEKTKAETPLLNTDPSGKIENNIAESPTDDTGGRLALWVGSVAIILTFGTWFCLRRMNNPR